MDTIDYYETSLQLHARHKGKLEVVGKTPVRIQDDMAAVFTPGVVEPCRLIAHDPENARRYTIKGNTVAVVSDGSAIPGLGNAGGLASLPAMESKALFFKEFGGVDAFPICLATQDVGEIVNTVKAIAPGFGGINISGISAPRCFDVEKRLKAELDVPVFHDDQHGTAVAVSAAVINAFRVLGRPLAEARTVINGAGAAGSAVARMLYSLGVRDIVICDSKGIVSASRIPEFGEDKLELLEFTNKDGLTGGLEKAIRGCELFIGVSKPHTVTEDMIRSMAGEPVVFALSDPEPEIMPDLAKAAGARITGTGRPDFPNQISDVLVSPGMFRGALDAYAADVTEAMKVAAAYALAGMVTEKELSEDYVLPPVYMEGVASAVAKAAADAWGDLEPL